MSKDIWHTTKEKPMMNRDIILCGDGWSMSIDIIPETVNTICWENVEKWCYLDDLLAIETELDRTRKALDVAVDALKYANKCIKGGCINWETEIDRALNKITALEQKDVK